MKKLTLADLEAWKANTFKVYACTGITDRMQRTQGLRLRINFSGTLRVTLADEIKYEGTDQQTAIDTFNLINDK